MKLKSDATSKLIEFNDEVKSLLKCNIGTTRSDSRLKCNIGTVRSELGGEYISSAWKEYCNLHIINMQYSSIYSPKQNGVAE